MFRPTTQAIISLLLAGCLTSSFASGPSIGIAMASGPFEMNSAPVKGNASVFDGSEIRTAEASSKLRMNGGARLELSTHSQAKIFTTHAVLERGAGQVESANPYGLEARTLRVTTSEAKAIARVQLDGSSAVLVSAVNGPVRVSSASGILLARVAAGSSLRFQTQANSDDFELTGCLLKKAGKVIIVDQTTGQYFELRGADNSTEFGNRVTVKGKAVAGATPVAGAAQVVGVQSLTAVAPGGCLATAAGVAADPLPGATTAAPQTAGKTVPKSGPNKAVIAGVVIAGGAGAGIAVAMASKNKSK